MQCAIFTSDVKVHISSTNRTFYPDASIVCGPYEKSDKDPNAITNPLLILEVLSESTAAFDRGTKFTHYRQIRSLKEYVLISQDEIEYATSINDKPKENWTPEIILANRPYC